MGPCTSYRSHTLPSSRGSTFLRANSIGTGAEYFSLASNREFVWFSPSAVGMRTRLISSHRPSRIIDQFRVDRKSTRLNSSHVAISYAVFCLKKKKVYSVPTTSTISLHKGG